MPEQHPTVEIFVEIPKGSRNKYEFDHELHTMRLDRRLSSSLVYPADYGFIPNSLGEDQDPLDAMILLDEPTYPGVIVTGRPVGVFHMSDEKGPDAKIICMPEWDSIYPNIEEVSQLPASLLNEIEHFFDVYKDLEPDKHAITNGFGNRDEALRLIDEAYARLRNSEQ